MKVLAAFFLVAVACEVSALPRRRSDEPSSTGDLKEKIAADVIINSPVVQRIEAEMRGAQQSAVDVAQQSAVDVAQQSALDVAQQSALDAGVSVARVVNEVATGGSRLAAKVADKVPDLGMSVRQRVANGSAHVANAIIKLAQTLVT